MKFFINKNIFLLISVCLLSVSLCEKQLFDKLDKDFISKEEKSLFNEIEKSYKNKYEEPKSLFENINFSQIGEKTNLGKHETFSNSFNQNMNRNSLNNKSKSSIITIGEANTNKNIRASAPLGPSIKTQLEIEKLQNKVTILMEINSKLNKKVQNKKRLNKKHERVTDDIITFIQSNEDDVNGLKDKIESKQKVIQSKLDKKETDLNNIVQKTQNNYLNLVQKLADLNKKFEIVTLNENRPLGDKIDIKRMNINKKLEVEGNTIVNEKIFTKIAEIGSLKIDAKNLAIKNENTKLVIGTKIIHFNELIKNLKLMHMMKTKCGDDLSKCMILSRSVLLESSRKQDKILMDLLKLKRDAHKMMKN